VPQFLTDSAIGSLKSLADLVRDFDPEHGKERFETLLKSLPTATSKK
jgi:hypothetical protein